VAQLEFRARGLYPCEGNRGPQERMVGRWRVDFEGDEQDAVALFASHAMSLRGTFLTGTGDYRYLAGFEANDELTLSCFDGAHAFLFKAQLQPDGSLRGDFWSGNWHHETWTAVRDDAAELADPFAQVRWNGTKRLEDLAFPDLLAKTRKLKAFAGPATLLVVFGSWCPNCNDEAALLKELDATYRERGLRILLLAFELTGDFRRDAEQVRIFQERHGLAELPAFLCGTADKAEATKALGLVDRVRAFPTTIFVGADGLPKAIHSGFAGPATGEEHQKLRRDFAARIEALLPPR
jgi:thiol-disulfide isomerase/thioredoxin